MVKRSPKSFDLRPWDKTKFFKQVGRKAEQDDLERVNCSLVGKEGHQSCGVCMHNLPLFLCIPCFAAIYYRKYGIEIP